MGGLGFTQAQGGFNYSKVFLAVSVASLALNAVGLWVTLRRQSGAGGQKKEKES
jgi:Ca2+/H+ antiporter